MFVINAKGRTLSLRVIALARERGYSGFPGEENSETIKSSQLRRMANDAVNYLNDTGRWAGTLEVVAGGLLLRLKEEDEISSSG